MTKSVRDFSVDSKVYSLDVVQRVLLSFVDRGSFSLHDDKAENLIITIRYDTDSELTGDDLVDQIHNELLDQALRERISTQTEKERELILAYTFSNTKLVK